jgi:hypothetical protein
MLYQELNKALPFDKKMEHIYTTIESIVAFADKEKLKYYICGGTALAIYNKAIYRQNEDLELSIDYDQKDTWISFLEKNQFKFQEMGSDWPLGNKKMIFRSKLQLKIELILWKNQGVDKDILKINIKDLNINIYKPINIFYLKLKYTRKKEKIIRTKDKIDLLKFKEYLLDIIQKSE